MEQAKAKTKRKGNYRPANKRIDTAKAIKQRIEKGMTLQEIADNQGVCKQAVSRVLQRVTDIDLLNTYKSKRADVYASLEHEILNSIDHADIKDASLLQRITAAGILKTHENLETGRATSILDVDIRALIASVQQSHTTTCSDPGIIDVDNNVPDIDK